MATSCSSRPSASDTSHGALDALSSCHLSHRRCGWFFPCAKWPRCTFPISKLGGDVEEVGGGFWSTATELVHERLICGVVGEGIHDVGVGDIG